MNLLGGEQTITRNVGTETFYNIKVLSSVGLTLGSNVQVNNELTMNGPDINTGANRLIIGSGPATPGLLTHNSGYIIGKL